MAVRRMMRGTEAKVEEGQLRAAGRGRERRDGFVKCWRWRMILDFWQDNAVVGQRHLETSGHNFSSDTHTYIK